MTQTAQVTEAAEPTRILVVEDERIVARDIQAALQQLGYDVPATAATGDNALRLTCSERANDRHVGFPVLRRR